MRPGILCSIATFFLYFSLIQSSKGQCPAEAITDGDCLVISYFQGVVPTIDPPIVVGFDFVSGSGGGTYQFVVTGEDPASCSGNFEKAFITLDINGGECVYEASILPVVLESYEARKVGDRQVSIRWSTSNEINNDYFEVFRSNDGRSFETLGTIRGNGSTSSQNSYEFVDEKSLDGSNYYYVSQVDFDGNTTNFDTKIVNLKTDIKAEISVRNRELTVSDLTTIATVQIISLDGRIVLSSKIENNEVLDLYDLNQGVYIINVSEGHVSKSVKLFIK